MSISLNANFELLSAGLYLDARQQFNTLIEMKDFTETSIPDGFITYNKETQKHYVFSSSNTVDTTLGKWREYTGEGGSSEKQIKDWVSGSSYLEGDYIYYEGELYRCLATNNNVDFNETNWEQLTYGIDELTKEDVERLLGLTKEEIEAKADLILDTEVRIDKTYSSSKIYTDIQQCLEDSKTYTLKEIAKLNGSSYKVVTSTSEMTSESIIYLLASGNTYDMYIIEEDGTTTKIGDMNIDLSQYYTKAEIDNDFLKKADADGKFATITTVDGKVDKTDIVDNLTSIDTDKPLSANQGKILNDTKLNKTDANKLNCVSIDNVSLKEYILTNFTEREKTYYLIAKSTCTDLPKASNFYITVETPGLYTYKVTAKELNDSDGIHVCTYRTLSSSWTEWKKVCTTTVADVDLSEINDKLTQLESKRVYNSLEELNTVKGLSISFTSYEDNTMKIVDALSPIETFADYFSNSIKDNRFGIDTNTYGFDISLLTITKFNDNMTIIRAYMSNGKLLIRRYLRGVLENWKYDKTKYSTVEDVGVTTITPVNGNITGTIEYMVKNGICYVSMKDLMSKVSASSLSISTTMPKPSINVNTVSVSSSGNIANIHIDKGTTYLIGDFYQKNAPSSCIFSYPVAE